MCEEIILDEEMIDKPLSDAHEKTSQNTEFLIKLTLNFRIEKNITTLI